MGLTEPSNQEVSPIGELIWHSLAIISISQTHQSCVMHFFSHYKVDTMLECVQRRMSEITRGSRNLPYMYLLKYIYYVCTVSKGKECEETGLEPVNG